MCPPGGNAGPAESDVWTDVEDAEVDAAEGVETRARPRACGDASDDAEDAAAGEGKATLTRTRLGAAARPADADDGEAIAGADVVRVLTPNRCGKAVFRSCSAFLAQAFLSDTPTDTRNAARSKSSVSRWISVSCSRATTSSGAVAAEGLETRSRRACGDACDDTDDADVVVAEGVETRTRSRARGDACDDAENAAAGEGEETLTRTRLEADARPTDADEGEAIVDVDVVGVPTRGRFGVAVY